MIYISHDRSIIALSNAIKSTDIEQPGLIGLIFNWDI